MTVAPHVSGFATSAQVMDRLMRRQSGRGGAPWGPPISPRAATPPPKPHPACGCQLSQDLLDELGADRRQLCGQVGQSKGINLRQGALPHQLGLRRPPWRRHNLLLHVLVRPPQHAQEVVPPGHYLVGAVVLAFRARVEDPVVLLLVFLDEPLQADIAGDQETV